jgi:hypothetical protein
MNLQLIKIGNRRSTLVPGTDYHSPLTWDEDLQIRMVFIPDAPLEKSVMFFRSDAGRALGHTVPAHITRHCELTPNDEGVVRATTPGGIQLIHGLYWTGFTKVMMHSKMDRAVEVRAWLAKKSSELAFYGIAFRDISAEEGIAKLQQAANESAASTNLANSIAQLATVVTSMNARLESLEGSRLGRMVAPIVHNDRQTSSVRELHAWIKGDAMNEGTDAAMAAKEQFTTAAFLAHNEEVIGKPGRPTSVAGLTKRCLNYCHSIQDAMREKKKVRAKMIAADSRIKSQLRESDCSYAPTYEVYGKTKRTKVFYFNFKDMLTVYESGWGLNKPIPEQMDLFNQANDQLKKSETIKPPTNEAC